MACLNITSDKNGYVDWWRDTHNDDASVGKMWDSWAMPHRDHVLGALTLLSPVSSVYELGCGSGPNLRRIREFAPSVALGGAEPCEALAAWAEQRLGIVVDRTVLPEVTNGVPWDVVLSCYTLAYLDTPDVMAVLRTLRSRGHRALVLLEPDARGDMEGLGVMQQGPDEHGRTLVSMPIWLHDYFTLLPAAGWTLRWRWPITPVGALRVAVVAT